MNLRRVLPAALLAFLLTAPALRADSPAVASDGTYGQKVHGQLGNASNGVSLPSAWSFTAWVYLTEGGSYTQGGQVPIGVLTSQGAATVSGLVSTGQTAEIIIEGDTVTGAQYLSLGRANSYVGTRSTTAIPLNTWTHIGLTVDNSVPAVFNGKTVTYYVNGVAAGTGIYTGLDITLGGNINEIPGTGNSTGLFALMGNLTNRKFKGALDDVQIWTEVRTQAQIAASMTTPPSGTEPSLIGWYPFEEGTGTTSANADTGNNITGPASLIGGVTWTTRPTAVTGPLVVTNTGDDENDATTLRGAIKAAKTRPGADTITFAPTLSGETIELSLELVVNDTTAKLTIDASGLSRPVKLSPSPSSFIRILRNSSNSELTVKNVAFVNGNAASDGGAIKSLGPLELDSCTLKDNVASTGGAISADGPLTLLNCSLHNNKAFGTNPRGGAIEFVGLSLTLTNCTLSGNEAKLDGGSAITKGGAIYVGGAEAKLNHCTIAGNTADVGGGVFAEVGTGGRVDLLNSVIANNTGTISAKAADVEEINAGTVRSFYSNIIRFLRRGDGRSEVNNTDPKLRPLGDYGGPTQTMPPLPGSPTIDAAGTGMAKDQRGFDRDRRPDIGACEANVVGRSDTLTVTTLTDELDSGPNTGTGLSLREAVRDVPENGRIVFSPVFFPGTGEKITLKAALGPIEIKRTVEIVGNANTRGVSIDGGGATAIFLNSAEGTVRLTQLIFTHGNKTGGSGGAIFNPAAGKLELRHCTLSTNTAAAGGGAIGNEGKLDVQNCTFSDNSTPETGGAILNSGKLAVLNSTFSGNSARYGGALDLGPNSTDLTLTHCTITENHATEPGGAGGGVYSQADWRLLVSIVWGNTGGSPATDDDIVNDGKKLTLGGKSIVRTLANVNNGRIGGNVATQLNSADPLLGPLQDNGGATFTRALATGSPAINQATVSVFTKDQRDVEKAGARDIGAFEFAVANAGSVAGTLLGTGIGTGDGFWNAFLTYLGVLTGQITVQTGASPALNEWITRVAGPGATIVKLRFKAKFDDSGVAIVPLRGGLSFKLTRGGATGNEVSAELTGPGFTSATSVPATTDGFGRRDPVPAELVGRYSVVIPHTLPSSAGISYGSFTVAATGAVKFTGTLVDGTKCSFGTFLAGSAVNGGQSFAARAPLYGGKGYLLFDAKFTTTDAPNAGTGVATLSRPAGLRGAAPTVMQAGYYESNIGLTFMRYEPPAPRQHATASLVASGGAGKVTIQPALTSPPTFAFTLQPTGRSTSTTPGFSLSLIPGTGLFRGTRPNPVTGGKPLKFGGVIFQLGYDAALSGLSLVGGFGYVQANTKDDLADGLLTDPTVVTAAPPE